MELVQEKLDFLVDLVNDDNWQQVLSDNKIITQKRSLPNSSIDCFRSYGMVNSTCEELMEFIWDTYSDKDSIKIYDPDVVEYNIVENTDNNTDNNIDNNTRICHQINNLPWPIWPRESVYLQKRLIREDASYILMYSVETNATPIQSDKFVRTNINISAYVLIPQKASDESGCMVYRIAHVDPAGSIPIGVVNSYASKTANMIRHLQSKYNRLVEVVIDE